MQQTWIGIDVAKDDFEAATPEGVTQSFPNNLKGAEAFLEWARAVPGFSGYVAMEATGVYSLQLAIIFLDLKVHPAIINPCHIHAYGRSSGRRNKRTRSTPTLSPGLPTSASPAFGSRAMRPART